MKVLRRTQFGNPILRRKARQLSDDEIMSEEIQELISDMRNTLRSKKYGVGIAAPQVGQSVALSVIEIQRTRLRPDLPKSDQVSLVIINPKIAETYGQKEPMWEGCLSLSNVFAKAERYERIRVRYTDEHGKDHEQDFDGLLAHVVQHEIDHLNGILFVDRVKDPKTYTSESEYLKVRKRTDSQSK